VVHAVARVIAPRYIPVPPATRVIIMDILIIGHGIHGITRAVANIIMQVPMTPHVHGLEMVIIHPPAIIADTGVQTNQQIQHIRDRRHLTLAHGDAMQVYIGTVRLVPIRALDIIPQVQMTVGTSAQINQVAVVIPDLHRPIIVHGRVMRTCIGTVHLVPTRVLVIIHPPAITAVMNVRINTHIIHHIPVLHHQTVVHGCVMRVMHGMVQYVTHVLTIMVGKMARHTQP